MDPDVGDTEARSLQIAIPSTVSWDPSNPLGRVDHRTERRHVRGLARAAIVVVANLNIERVLIPCRLHVKNTRRQIAVATVATLVVAVGVVMPRGLLETAAVVLSEVRLRTTTREARVTIASNAAIGFLGVGEIEVIVHTSNGARQVHVKFDVPTREVEGGLGAHTPLTIDVPAACCPCDMAYGPKFDLLLKVLGGIWAIGDRRSWRRRRPRRRCRLPPAPCTRPATCTMCAAFAAPSIHRRIIATLPMTSALSRSSACESNCEHRSQTALHV